MDMIGLLLWNRGFFSHIAEHLKGHKEFWGEPLASFEGKHSVSNTDMYKMVFWQP